MKKYKYSRRQWLKLLDNPALLIGKIIGAYNPSKDLREALLAKADKPKEYQCEVCCQLFDEYKNDMGLEQYICPKCYYPTPPKTKPEIEKLDPYDYEGALVETVNQLIDRVNFLSPKETNNNLKKK